VPDLSDVDRSNQSRGAWGERLAASHYERAGYEVIDRNWRDADGELDLVLRRGELYVFSEVKTRRSDRFGSPASAVTPDKQRRIRRLAVAWLRTHGLRAVDMRFDVVAITGVHVQIIESAF
jgi:putative endonuclease